MTKYSLGLVKEFICLTFHGFLAMFTLYISFYSKNKVLDSRKSYANKFVILLFPLTIKVILRKIKTSITEMAWSSYHCHLTLSSNWIILGVSKECFLYNSGSKTSVG